MSCTLVIIIVLSIIQPSYKLDNTRARTLHGQAQIIRAYKLLFHYIGTYILHLYLIL